MKTVRFKITQILTELGKGHPSHATIFVSALATYSLGGTGGEGMVTNSM